LTLLSKAVATTDDIDQESPHAFQDTLDIAKKTGSAIQNSLWS
jgi:hypothetical protein